MNNTDVIATARQRRIDLGMSLAELARRSGIPRPNLSRIERGLSDPRLSTLERMLAALDLACKVVPRSPATLSAVIERAERGRRTLTEAGISSSDPWRRLGRRAACGEDVASEARALIAAEQRAG